MSTSLVKKDCYILKKIQYSPVKVACEADDN